MGRVVTHKGLLRQSVHGRGTREDIFIMIVQRMADVATSLAVYFNRNMGQVA